MSDDTQTDEKMVSTTSGLNRGKKITVTSMGGGRKPSDQEQAAGGALIGTIFGQATGVRTVEAEDSKTGELVAHTSITGTFFTKPAEGAKAEPMESNTLYLPSGFHEAMADALAPIDQASGVRKQNGNVIEFAFDVRCVQTSNKAGYGYLLKPVYEDAKVGVANLHDSMAERIAAKRLALLGTDVKKPGVKTA